MTERERLIRLIKSSGVFSRCGCHYNDGDRFCQDLADYLLENGVIVPPVMVGQTVYGISRGAIIPIGIDRIQYSNRGIDILGRNERYFGNGTITLHPDNEFGIEWYATKEEAEQALKARGKE